jgi:hypothetical protein
MTTLWLAFAIYILGVAVVLFFRPAIMFRSGNGTWREFGLANTGNYTVFPFWMFTLIWAIASYVLATLGTVLIASAALQGMPIMEEAPVNNTLFTPVSKMPTAPPAASPAMAASPATTLPGYYVLDTGNGPPKYIYFGTSPPTLANIA